MATTCPNCNQPTISNMEKIGLGGGRYTTCPYCGVMLRVSEPWGVAAGLVVFAGFALPLAFRFGIATTFALAIACSVLYVCLFLKYAPLKVKNVTNGNHMDGHAQYAVTTSNCMNCNHSVIKYRVMTIIGPVSFTKCPSCGQETFFSWVSVFLILLVPFTFLILTKILGIGSNALLILPIFAAPMAIFFHYKFLPYLVKRKCSQ